MNDARVIPDAIAMERKGFAAAVQRGDPAAAWRALERAHILSQPMLGQHMGIHWLMLRYAIRLRDVREILGQIMRLVLAPAGALAGRIPAGNTGRSNVSAFAPMPIPDDLLAIIGEGA